MKSFYEYRSEHTFVGTICKTPFPLHVHEVVEIVHLLQGEAMLTANSTQYMLHPGDSLAIFPTVPHSYDYVSPDAEGLCVMFLPQAIREHTDTFARFRPAAPFLSAEVFDADLQETTKKLIALGSGTESPLKMAYIHLFISQLLLKLDLHSLDCHLNDDLTQKALTYISQHCQEEVSLDNVSKALGISRSHLSHIFSEQLNINFRRYINKLRIDQACSLLQQTDMTITQIGYSCGFNNLRTFRRAFTDEMGTQPGEYRLSVKKN